MSDRAPSAEDVIRCYRLILGREPESADAVARHLADGADLKTLRERFVNSDEFGSRSAQPSGPALQPTPENYDNWPGAAPALPLIDANRFAQSMAGAIWLVSHGGVGSEYLYQVLGLAYPSSEIDGRPLRGVVSHLARPYRQGPLKCIYLYGNLRAAMASQLRRGMYDNPRKIKNNILHRPVHSWRDLLGTLDPDPFGIKRQFSAFCRDLADYPILLVKRSALPRHLSRLAGFAHSREPASWIERQRETGSDGSASELPDELALLYQLTEQIMDAMPELVLRLPVWLSGYRYAPRAAAIGAGRPLLDAMPAARHFIEAKLGELAEPTTLRIKHSFHFTAEDGRAASFVNLRHDLATPALGSIGYLLRIDAEAGAARKVHHDDIRESDLFTGAEDPRYFRRGGHLAVLFNAACHDGTRRLFIHFEHTEATIKLHVTGLPLQREEKNWTPYVVGDVIYLIYSFNPTVVLRLDDDKTGRCSVASDAPLALDAAIEPLYPYGGTSLSLWSWPYYVGLVHTREPWRPAFVVFDAEAMQLVAVGEPFQVIEPLPGLLWRGRDVQYPYHLDISDGRCRMGIECQDRCPTEYEIDFEEFSGIVSSLIATKVFYPAAIR